MSDDKTAGILFLDDLNKPLEKGLFGIPDDTDDDPEGSSDITTNFIEPIDNPGENGDPGASSLTNNNTGSAGDDLFDPPGDKNDSNSEKQNKGGSPDPEPATSYHHQVLKNLFGDKPLTVLQTDESGNEVEVSVDELELDDELLATIIRGKYEQEREEAIKDKISVDGVSNLTMELIEIEKKGGKISDLLELRQHFTDPLDRLDITTPQGQKEVVRMGLLAAGTDEEDVEGLVALYEQKGELESRALKYEAKIREEIQKRVDARKLEVEQSLKDQEERLKQYKKNLRENIDKSFSLKDSAKAKLLDFATKQNAQKKFAIHDAFMAAWGDPERATELALFLLDREEFFKQVTEKTKKEQHISSAVRLGTVKAKDASSGSGFNYQKKEEETSFFPLE